MTATLLIPGHPPVCVVRITGQFNKLPAKVKRSFDDAVEGKCAIFIPAVVLWELSLLIKAGTVQPSVTLEEYVRERFFAKAISILDITPEDILISHGLSFHKDPFDVLIVATALRLDCPLITADSVIHKTTPCDLFWD